MISGAHIFFFSIIQFSVSLSGAALHCSPLRVHLCRAERFLHSNLDF